MLGIDGTVVIIRHGNRVINAHMRDVRKFLTGDVEQSNEKWNNEKSHEPLMTNSETNSNNEK